MVLLTFLLSTNSLKSITNLEEFIKAVRVVNKQQGNFINDGFEIGFACREGKPNIPIEDLLELAEKYSTIPFTWENNIKLMSITPDKDTQFIKHVGYAKHFAACYKGPSEMVREKIPLRLVYGSYKIEKPVDIDDPLSLARSSLEKLSNNIKYLNKVCNSEGVYALIENMPKDTPYFELLWLTVEGILSKTSSTHVKSMVDIGNLITSVDGVQYMDKQEAVRVINSVGIMLGGYHLKNAKNGKPLHALTEEGDIEIEQIREWVIKMIVYPLVVEPMPSVAYNVLSGIADVRHILNKKR